MLADVLKLWVSGTGCDRAMNMEQPFSRQLDTLLANVREDILQQHEHHMTVQRLRMRALVSKSAEFSFRLDRPPDVIRAPGPWRKLQPWDSEQSCRSSTRSRGSKERLAARPHEEGPTLKVTERVSAADVNEVESLELAPERHPVPALGDQPKKLFASAFTKPENPSIDTQEGSFRSLAGDDFGRQTSMESIEESGEYVEATASIPTIPGLTDAEDEKKLQTGDEKSATFKAMRRESEESKRGDSQRESKISFLVAQRYPLPVFLSYGFP